MVGIYTNSEGIRGVGGGKRKGREEERKKGGKEERRKEWRKEGREC